MHLSGPPSSSAEESTCLFPSALGDCAGPLPTSPSLQLFFFPLEIDDSGCRRFQFVWWGWASQRRRKDIELSVVMEATKLLLWYKDEYKPSGNCSSAKAVARNSLRSFIFLPFPFSFIHLSLKMSPEILELAHSVKMYHVEAGVQVVSLKKTERCPEVECGAELC